MHITEEKGYQGPGNNLKGEADKGGHFTDKTSYKEYGELGTTAPATKNPEKVKGSHK